MTDMRISLVFRAIDAASGVISGITGKTGALIRQVRGSAEMTRALGGVKEGLDKIGNRALVAGGALAAGVGLHTAIAEGAQAQHKLAALANIADLSNSAHQAMAQAIRGEVKQTNQSVLELTEGMNVLMGAGWDEKKSLTAIRAIGRAATATQATVGDLGKTALAGVDNLNVPVQQMGKYLDVLAQAGKEGNFELKDMARFMPSIGALAGGKGIQGIRGTSQLGAAFQVARMGAGSSEEAGTNFLNFLTKLTSPEAAANFAKKGVNLEAEFSKAQASGDVLAHMGELIQRVTKGNDFRLGEIFGDMQVKQFLAPFLKNLGKYKEIQSRSMGAVGVVDRDYARMLGTFLEKWKRFRNTFTMAVLPRLEPWLERIGGWLDKLDQHPKLFDALFSGILALIGGGLLAKALSGLMGLGGGISRATDLASTFRKAIKTLGIEAVLTSGKLKLMDRARWGFSTDWLRPSSWGINGIGKGLGNALKAPFGKSFWSSIGKGSMSGFKSLGKFIPSLGGASSLFSGTGLLGAGKGLLGALKAVFLLPIKAIGAGIATLGGPVLLVIAAVAVAALLIYKYWEPIKAFFSGICQGFKENLDLVMPVWDAFSEAIAGVFKALVSLVDVFVPVQAGQEGVNGAMERGKAIGEGLAWVFGIVLTAAKWVAQGVEAVVIIVVTLVDLIVVAGKTIWKALTGDWKTIGKDWSGFSDRFWKRLENSSMNPDRQADGPAKAAEAAGKLGRKETKTAPDNPLPKLADLKPAPSSGASAPVVIQYSPKVEIRGGASQEDKAWFDKKLEEHKATLVRLVDEAMQRRKGWNGAPA